MLLILLFGCATSEVKQKTKIEKPKTEKQIIKSKEIPKWKIYCTQKQCHKEFRFTEEKKWIKVPDKEWGETKTVSSEDNLYYYFLDTMFAGIMKYRYSKKEFTINEPPATLWVLRKLCITSKSLNIRNGPGMNYAKIGTLGWLDCVLILDKNDSWAKILIEGRDWTNLDNIGWVSSQFLGSESEAYLAEKKRRIKGYGWNAKTIKAILDGKIFLGMTTKQVIESWGKPDDINRTVGSWGIHEQWVYRRGGFEATYLYFENGKLTSWQD